MMRTAPSKGKGTQELTERPKLTPIPKPNPQALSKRRDKNPPLREEDLAP